MYSFPKSCNSWDASSSVSLSLSSSVSLESSDETFSGTCCFSLSFVFLLKLSFWLFSNSDVLLGTFFTSGLTDIFSVLLEGLITDPEEFSKSVLEQLESLKQII